MERAKRYLVNALILSGCTLLMRTVGVAFNAFCVDRVGAEGMGLFSLVMSVYTFAVTFATSGVNLAATRLVALHVGRGEGNSARSAMRSCLLYAAAFGTAATVGLFFFAKPCAVHFLHEALADETQRMEGSVVVVGGGNVAIDCARTAVRFGAEKVSMVCLESRETMPASKDEIAEAEEERVEICAGWGPKELLRTKAAM